MIQTTKKWYRSTPWVIFMMLTAILMLSLFSMFSSNRQDDGLAVFLSRNPLLVDVRTPDEFRSGHLPGAVNYPLSDLSKHLGTIQGAQKPVLVYCRSGMRSAQAMQFLKQQGVTDIMNGGGYEHVKKQLELIQK